MKTMRILGGLFAIIVRVALFWFFIGLCGSLTWA
jgi:hypothetical protein